VEPLENNVSPEHPLAELATLVAGLGAIGLAVLVLAWLAVEGAVRWLPATVEVRVFSNAAPAGTPAPQLDELVERLARHWPQHGYPLDVAILEVPVPNAFALPGGRLLVSRGLIDQAGSENELAFVLGHELGHVAGRDPLRALGRGLLVSLALSVIGGSEGASVAATSAQLGERSFSRSQERAADRFGLALVAAEYGTVAGAADFLRRLPDAGAGGWLSTHPGSAERVAELERLAQQRGWPTEGELTPLPAGLRHE
jgi:predicted Zn-dependent protease